MTVELVIAGLIVLAIAAFKASSTKTRRTTATAASAPRDYSHLDDHPIQVVGESNYQAELIAICGPYTAEGHRTRTSATLIREPDNQHDPNAIRVEIQGRTVGYIDRAQASQWAPRMDVLSADARMALVPAIIMGGWHRSASDHGAYGVRIARPDLPRKPRAKKAAKA